MLPQFLVPLGLFLFATYSKRAQAQPPKPAPAPSSPAPVRLVKIGPAVIDPSPMPAPAKAMPAAKAAPAKQRRPTRSKPAAPAPKPPLNIGPVTIEHPDVIPAASHDQAAVDAAVTQAIKDSIPKPPPSAAEPAPATAAPAAAPAAATRSPRAAAVALQRFLIRTGRFGTLKDRPAEVIEAQRDLGVTPDGLVGKRTRAAAQRHGVALPPLNPGQVRGDDP